MNELILASVLLLDSILSILYYDKENYNSIETALKIGVELGFTVALYFVVLIAYILTKEIKEFLLFSDKFTVILILFCLNCVIPCTTGAFYTNETNPKWKKYLTIIFMIMTFLSIPLILIF